MHTDTQGQASPQQAPQGAQEDSNLAATAPGQMRVIKRNGKVVPYTDDKITVAISKAFLAVEGGTAAASSRIHETVQRLTEQVSAIFKRRMPSGGTIHIEEIQDQVELALMRAGEQKIAHSYVLYREEQTRKRAEKAKAEALAALGRKVVTPILPTAKFYKAEDYHQDYYKNNPDNPYVQAVAKPKVVKFKKQFKDKLKTSS